MRQLTRNNTAQYRQPSTLHRTLINSVLEPTLWRERSGFHPGWLLCTDQIERMTIASIPVVRWHRGGLRQPGPKHDMERSRKLRNPRQAGLAIIQSMYRDANCSFVRRGQFGREFNVASGVKQGCILSPLLFLLFLGHEQGKVNNSPEVFLASSMQMNRLERPLNRRSACLCKNQVYATPQHRPDLSPLHFDGEPIDEVHK